MAAESFRSGWSDYVNDAAVGNVLGLLARLTTNAKMRHDGYGGMAGRVELLTASRASAAGRCASRTAALLPSSITLVASASASSARDHHITIFLSYLGSRMHIGGNGG
jgi:hypothetical protein